MTREEHKEKLYFLQVSEKFFSELPVRRLLHASGGDTMLRIYLQAHCVALRTGGVLELHEGMQPAEEIALLIGSPDTEIPMVAAAMQHCLAYGLISASEGEGEGKIINFSLTADYTRAWTRDAIARREKRETERLETAEGVPAIENKGGEEKEKKPSNKAKAQKEADEMFERLWRQYFKGYKEDKSRVKPATRYRLYKDYGEERCQKALDAYKVSKKVKDGFILQAKNFFNIRIFDYLDGDAGQDAQPAHAQPAQPVTEETVRDTIMREGIWNIRTQAWDRAKLDEIREKIGPEMAAAIEAKMA